MKNCIIITILFLLLDVPLKPQEGIIHQKIHLEELHDTIPILKKKYDHNKEIPQQFLEPAIIALSYYPELKQTHIRFIKKKIKTTMAARPSLGFLFHSRKNRSYNIFINTSLRNDHGILLENVDFNKQIGIIGHELAHILDYEHKNSWQILKTGFLYLFPFYRRKLEYATDKTTIEHGLGWQIRDFSHFVLYHSKASNKYKSYKKKYYFTPKDLLYIISAIPSYNETTVEDLIKIKLH